MEEKSVCFNLIDDYLPKHIWETIIFPKLGLKDLSRCRAVCHSWKSMLAEKPGYHHRLPWLMISKNNNTQSGTLLSLSENKIYNINFTRLATEAFCCASSQGYLIMANRNTNFLYNPFSKTTITLPKQYVPHKDAQNSLCRRNFGCYFCKAHVSSSPSPADTSQCVIAALGSNTHIVEMCRPQDSKWSVFGTAQEEINNIDEEQDSDTDEEKEYLLTDGDGYLFSDDDVEYNDVEIQLNPEEQLEEDGWLFHDILFYKGMLYGLTRKNILVSFEFEDSSKSLGYRALNMLPMKPYTPDEDTTSANYLVESSGQLLMVHRSRYIINDGIRPVIHSTINFLVYKLDQSGDLLKWVQVHSLGDQMLFLGQNSSVSISAIGIPGFNGNCIYFTDDKWPSFWLGYESRPSCLDNGVFYLDEGHIEPFFTPDDSHQMNAQPVWVTPETIFHE